MALNDAWWVQEDPTALRPTRMLGQQPHQEWPWNLPADGVFIGATEMKLQERVGSACNIDSMYFDKSVGSWYWTSWKSFSNAKELVSTLKQPV